MFLRIILLIVGCVGGVFVIIYREKIARTIGKNDLAEKYLGAGGTYTMWVLIGMIMMILGLFIVTGKLAFVGL